MCFVGDYSVHDYSIYFSFVAYYKVCEIFKFSCFIGTSVASVLATDVDDGVNKVFTYAKISGDPFSMFSITGNDILTTSVPVNYETNTIFTLIITATDTGSSPLTGTTTVQISVSFSNYARTAIIYIASCAF